MMSSHSMGAQLIGTSPKNPSKQADSSPKLKEWLEALDATHIPRVGGTRLIMNYLVTEGFKDAAEKLSAESGVSLSSLSSSGGGNGSNMANDVSASLEERIRIRDAIHNGRISEARQLLDQLHPRLLTNDSQLLFRLLQQQLIELIREQRVDEAIAFAQAELAPKLQQHYQEQRESQTPQIQPQVSQQPSAQPPTDSQQDNGVAGGGEGGQAATDVVNGATESGPSATAPDNGNADAVAAAALAELERTLALLAFDNPVNSPFGDLLHVSHRQKVASEVNAAILEMDGAESTVPSLVVALHMLLWAQDQLDKKKVKYPKMTDVSLATIETASVFQPASGPQQSK